MSALIGGICTSALGVGSRAEDALEDGLVVEKDANKRVQFGYGLNYLIDVENAVIVDVEATPARTYDEVAATKLMIKRTAERLGLKPKRLAHLNLFAFPS
jgi:hypothetical protein